MSAFVILDRDGVINQDSPEYIKSVEAWLPISGSLESIAALNQAGIKVFVATNQAGVARGKLTLTSLHEIHQHMLKAVKFGGGLISDIRYCPHHPDELCECRKPKPGLLLQLSVKHHLDLSEGYYVGDSEKDLDAASAAGCTGVLVLTGNGRATHKSRPDHSLVFDDLMDFTRYLISQKR